MVIVTSAVFASRFNQAVISRKRTFVIPVSKFSQSLLGLLFRGGYVHSYHNLDTQTYIVFLNLRSISFKLQPVAKVAQFRHTSARNFRRSSNSGTSFIVNTFTGFSFLDIAIISKLGGSVLYKLVPLKLCRLFTFLSRFLLNFWIL